MKIILSITGEFSSQNGLKEGTPIQLALKTVSTKQLEIISSTTVEVDEKNGGYSFFLRGEIEYSPYKEIVILYNGGKEYGVSLPKEVKDGQVISKTVSIYDLSNSYSNSKTEEDSIFNDPVLAEYVEQNGGAFGDGQEVLRDMLYKGKTIQELRAFALKDSKVSSKLPKNDEETISKVIQNGVEANYEELYQAQLEKEKLDKKIPLIEKQDEIQIPQESGMSMYTIFLIIAVIGIASYYLYKKFKGKKS